MASQYMTQTEIANSADMRNRVSACLAEKRRAGHPVPDGDADGIAYHTRRDWAATSEWDDYWVNWLTANPDDTELVGIDALTDGQIRGYVDAAYPLA